LAKLLSVQEDYYSAFLGSVQQEKAEFSGGGCYLEIIGAGRYRHFERLTGEYVKCFVGLRAVAGV
jgi:hypothetical protein